MNRATCFGIVRPTRKLAFVAAVVHLAASAAFGQSGAAEPVVVSTVVEQEITTGQTFVGTVMPMRTSVVGSAVDGRVLEVLVDEGDAVEMIEEADPDDETGMKKRTVGQPLAQLRTKTLQLEIDAAQAQLDQLINEHEELIRTLPEQEKQAQATLEETAALADFAESQHRRLQSLAKQSGAVTQDELDDAFSRMVAARQNHLKAESAAKLLAQTREAKLAQAKFRVLAQRAAVDRLEDVKQKYTVRAPFKGFVTAVHTENGAWLQQGDLVATVVELDPVEIDVALSEKFITKLHESIVAEAKRGKRPAATVLAAAVPGRSFEGEVRTIVPQADLRTRSFSVRVVVPNPDDNTGQQLKAGMLARVSLAVGLEQKATLVHKDALVLGGRSPTVVVVRTDPRTKQMVANPVAVELGVAAGSMMEVKGQVNVNDKVVVKGNERLRPGQQVRIQSERRPPTVQSLE